MIVSPKPLDISNKVVFGNHRFSTGNLQNGPLPMRSGDPQILQICGRQVIKGQNKQVITLRTQTPFFQIRAYLDVEISWYLVTKHYLGIFGIIRRNGRIQCPPRYRWIRKSGKRCHYPLLEGHWDDEYRPFGISLVHDYSNGEYSLFDGQRSTYPPRFWLPNVNLYS